MSLEVEFKLNTNKKLFELREGDVFRIGEGIYILVKKSTCNTIKHKVLRLLQHITPIGDVYDLGQDHIDFATKVEFIGQAKITIR